MKETIVLISVVSILILIIIPYPVIGTSDSPQYGTSTTMAPYHYATYLEMTDLLHSLQENHSDIMVVKSLGTTYEERDIWMVKLSDNPDLNENEPGVLLMGAHHGNELPSYESLLFFIKHMVGNYSKANTDNDHDGTVNEDPIDGNDNDNDNQIDEDPSEDRVRTVIDNTQIFIIPMVNPDGVEYTLNHDEWRKNRAPNYDDNGNILSFGVDLNRNYGFKWNLYDILPNFYGDRWTANPTSWNYRGENPFSEQETKAIKDFVEANDINISLSYHSYGEFINFPWSHTSGITPDERLYIEVGEEITSINKYDLYIGKQTLLPLPGGTIGTADNWLYGTQGILAYTIELCNTRAPTNPSTVYKYCLAHTGVNLYVSERAATINNDGPPRVKLYPSTVSSILSLLQQIANPFFKQNCF